MSTQASWHHPNKNANGTSSHDQLLSGSSLSVPVPHGNCFAPKTFCSRADNDMDIDDGDPLAAGIDPILYQNHAQEHRNSGGGKLNYEEKALEEDFQNLTLAEQESAERTLIGFSATAMTILNRWSTIQQITPNGGRRGSHESASHSVFVEDPAFLEHKFQELEVEIQTIELVVASFGNGVGSESDPDFGAYQTARNSDRGYVDDPRFRIGFLRAERYDARKAARRMLRYLREKLELFGTDKLTQDICLEDLGPDGLKYLELGAMQVLPARDAAGRRVIFMHEVLDGKNDEIRTIGVRKANFYFWTSLAEDDDEIGKVKGVVTILWRIHKPVLPDPDCVQAISQTRECCPSRISAYHLCHGPISLDLETIDFFARMVLPAIQEFGRLRYFRSHYLSTTECQHRLCTEYGVPVEALPINYSYHGGNNNNLISSSISSVGELFHRRYVKMWMDHRIRIDAQKTRLMASLATSTRDSSAMSIGNFSMFDESINSNGDSFSMSWAMRDSMTESDTRSMSWVMRSSITKGTADESTSTPIHGLTRSLDSIMKRDEEKCRDDSESRDDDTNKILEASLGVPELTKSDQDIQNTKSDAQPKETETTPKSRPLVEGDADHRHVGQPVFLSSGETSRPASVQDVLLGKGKPLQNHPGNLRIRELIASRFDEYDAAEKNEQTRISEEVVRTIAHSGGRFLEQLKVSPPPPTADEKQWVEIDNDNDARLKVAVKFRSIRKKLERSKAAAKS